MEKLKLDYTKFKDVTVKYRLYGEQLEAVKKLAAENNTTLKNQFDLMMNGGSIYDIQRKIDFWQKGTV